MKFPLRQLPDLVVVAIFQKMSPMELFHMSLTSKKMQKLIRLNRIGKVEHLEICIDRDPGILVGTGGNVSYRRKYGATFYTGDKLVMTFFNDQFVSEEKYWNFPSDPVKLGLEFLAEILKTFIRAHGVFTINYLKIDLNAIRDIDSFIDFWRLNDRNMSRIERLHICAEGNIEWTILKKMLDLFQNFEFLTLNVKVENGIEQEYIERITKLSQFKCYNANWLETNHFLETVNCKYGYFEGTSLGNQDLILFIRSWLNSTNTTLKTMEIVNNSGQSFNSDYLGHVLGLRIPIAGERDSTYYRFDTLFRNRKGKKEFKIRCRGGWDIRRRDGCLATIFLNPEYFLFIVWHDPYPSSAASFQENLNLELHVKILQFF